MRTFKSWLLEKLSLENGRHRIQRVRSRWLRTSQSARPRRPRTEKVEILSDQSNAAIMRHPGRAFPGVLVQGDSLATLCQQADLACNQVGRGNPGFAELNELRNLLWTYLTHYKATLVEHDMPLPFSD